MEVIFMLLIQPCSFIKLHEHYKEHHKRRTHYIQQQALCSPAHHMSKHQLHLIYSPEFKVGVFPPPSVQSLYTSARWAVAGWRPTSSNVRNCPPVFSAAFSTSATQAIILLSLLLFGFLITNDYSGERVCSELLKCEDLFGFLSLLIQ